MITMHLREFVEDILGQGDDELRVRVGSATSNQPGVVEGTLR